MTIPPIMPSLSIIVPVYRSALILPTLVKRLEHALLPTMSMELILVNDGSPDNSWEVIETLSAAYPWVRGINLMRNYGQHNALLSGIRAAEHEVIVTMDDDLQHPPEEISKLIAKLAEGFDVVYGTPMEEQHGFWRDISSQVTKIALQNSMGHSTARKVSAFRLFRTELRRAFANYQGPYVSIDVLLTWATVRFAAIPVPHHPRFSGVSNYTFRTLVRHAVNMLTGFSVLPLRIASLIGFVFTLFGIGVLIYVIARYIISGGSVPGFPFLASLIAIFSGAQLFALGIIGEYLARMHFRMMGHPTYTIRNQTRSEIPSQMPETALFPDPTQ